MEEKYFAASNSEKGFVSYFGRIFDPSEFGHIYIIKGGPGTGKSVFMRKIAERAEKEGKKVVRYYCSSDQTSLDGITVENDFAVLDGTAPHDTDATLPGAAEDIVDLGVFWDSNALASHREEIGRLNAEKKRAYSRTYRFLAAYGDVTGALRELAMPIFDPEKAEKYVTRRIGNARGKKYETHIAVCDSVGMEGRVKFASLEERASEVCRVDDSLGLSHLILSAALDTAVRRRLSVTVSYDPIICSVPDAVFFEESGILFESVPHGSINPTRFMDKEAVGSVKKKIKSAVRLREAMLSEAENALSDVKKAHFEIEKIYGAAMNFGAKERFTEKFINELF